MPLTLKQLRYVEALARIGNFREAAKALGISQPALTQSVRALEQHLGCALFDRLPGGIELTDVGRQVVSRTRELLPQVQALEQDVAAAVRVSEGTLSIVAGSYPGYLLVPETIAALSRHIPDLTVRYRENNWADFATLLVNRDVEIAVGDIGELRVDPRLQTARLGSEPLFYFCRPGHPLADRRGVDPDAIHAFPLAGNSAPPHISRLLGESGRGGVRDPETGVFQPRFQCTTLAAIKRIVVSTDALAMAPLPLLEEDIESGSLAVVDCSGELPCLDTGIVYLAGRKLSPVAAAFVRELKHQRSGMRTRAAPLVREPGL